MLDKHIGLHTILTRIYSDSDFLNEINGFCLILIFIYEQI